MTLLVPGRLEISPTVATEPVSLRAARSTSTTNSAAAQRASLRLPIGTVPA
jgi:hypothetical protein